MTIIRVGLDTSKHVFQVHGVDENEQPVLRRQIRRGAVEKFFAKLPSTRIGIEACSTEGPAYHGAIVRQISVTWPPRRKFSSSTTSPSCARW
jgi:hypothetical protein